MMIHSAAPTQKLRNCLDANCDITGRTLGKAVIFILSHEQTQRLKSVLFV